MRQEENLLELGGIILMKYYFEKRNKFTCPNCGKSFRTTFWKWFSCPHLFDIWRYIKCPHCGKRSWMKRVKK